MSRHSRNASTTLYVRNISDRVRYDDLRRLFQKYGKIIDVTIPLDYYSGLPKGFCFVEFEEPRDAEEAQYRMDRQRLFGRELDVEFARGIRKTPGEMRTRGKDDFDDHRGSRDRRDRARPDERNSARSRSRSRGARDDRPPRKERGGSSRRTGDRSARDLDAVQRSRSRSRNAASYSRSKSRGSRSYSKNRTPSPRVAAHNRSVSRSRSPNDRSLSRTRGSPRRNDLRSPVKHNMNSRSRSVSPA